MSTCKGLNSVDDLARLPGFDPAFHLGETNRGQAETNRAGNGKKRMRTETKRHQPETVAPLVMMRGETLVCLIPAVTASEANKRAWQGTMKRKLSVKEACRETLGPAHRLLSPFAEAYAAGKALRVVLTRLGGRKLDRLANLGAALKTVEDVIAGALLADDGDPRWQAGARQEPGGVVGVRITLEIA